MATGVLQRARVVLHERTIRVGRDEAMVVLVSSDQDLRDAQLPSLLKQHNLVPASQKAFQAAVNGHAYDTHGVNVLVWPAGKRRARWTVNRAAWDLPQRTITACNGVYSAGEQLVFQRASTCG